MVCFLIYVFCIFLYILFLFCPGYDVKLYPVLHLAGYFSFLYIFSLFPMSLYLSSVKLLFCSFVFSLYVCSGLFQLASFPPLPLLFMTFFLTTCIIHYFGIFQYFSLSTLSSLFSCICDFRYSCKG